MHYVKQEILLYKKLEKGEIQLTFQQEGYYLKWKPVSPLNKVSYVFGIEIGEHGPISSGMAARYTDAVLYEEFRTQIIRM